MLTRDAGILIPLFSLRTEDDLGRGEIGGLLPLADLMLAMGHRVVQLLPVDQTAPGESSPYNAMSVNAIDPLYLSTARLDGVDRYELAAVRRRLSDATPIDLKLYHELKHELLDQAFAHFQTGVNDAEHEAFNEFVEANREWLEDHALFCAIKEKYAWSSWEAWPAGLRNRESGVIATVSRELSAAITRHRWLQFAVYREWRTTRAALARRGVLIGGDFAFSPGRDSVEVWAHPEMFDRERTVGAPPDAFSATGQRWGLPMPAWSQMRATGFSLIRARARRARLLYDLVRVDHVVGLFRTYGFGADPNAAGAFDPADEAAQHRQGEEILRILREEISPAELIAEDLGVIPPFVRQTLARLALPGYKVMQWEREWQQPGEEFISPREFPALSVATTGTHDTASLVEWWRETALPDRVKFAASFGCDAAWARPAALSEPMIDKILTALYAAPSQLTVLPFQDLFGWAVRINTPGTVDPKNWTWRLPFALDHAPGDERLRKRLASLRALAQRSGRFNGDSPVTA